MQDLISTLSGKSILVTGASGFIGSRLVQVLSSNRNIKIKALVREYSRAVRIARFPIEIVKGNILHERDMKEVSKSCDIVFHCAYGNSGNHKEQKKVNIDGTKNILNACLENKIKRIVHVSTMVVYGMYIKGDIHERLPYKYSNNIYSDSKIKAEKKVFDYHKRYDLPVSVIQPSCVYGPWSPSFTIYPITQMKKGIVILPNNGESICNAVYIDDVIQALLLASIKKSAIGQAFLISGKDYITWKSFYSYYESILKKKRLVCMEISDIKRIIKRQKRENSSLAQIKKILKNNDAIDFLLQLPIIKKPYSIFRPLVPDQKRKLIRNKILGQKNYKNRKFTQNILENLSFYKSKAANGIISIKKTEKLLGFNPKFSFEEGMKLTEKWIKWIHLDN